MVGKRYFLIVAVPVLLLVLILLGLSFYLQPFTGDLTRIGGYTENDFGWNETQLGYEDVGTYYARSRPENEVEDYVVYGDSFSHWCAGDDSLPICFQWTAFFKNSTGLQGLTYHQDHYSIEAFIQRVSQLSEKPKFVVYQSVGRYAIPRLMKVADGEECVVAAPLNVGRFSESQAADRVIGVERLKRPVPFDMNIPSAYLKQLIGSLRKPRVLKERLVVSNTLFSSSQNNELLYHREDLNKTRYNSEHYATAKCGMNIFAAKIRLALDLPTFFLIAPDKSSVYGPLIENKDKRINSFLPDITDQNVNFVDLLSPMSAAIDKGVTDVYLPNDTHWGAKGGAIAASALEDAIEKSM